MLENEKCYSKNLEYFEIISQILNNEEFEKRKEYKHHGDISVYEHSLKVSFLAYKISKKIKGLDSSSVAIGGLLHDFYYEPWQDNCEKKPFLKKHGFVHAYEALLNSREYFPDYMNEKVENIIERHMFPLNLIPPKYKEAWLITVVDKWVSLETITQPTFFKQMIGINYSDGILRNKKLIKILLRN